MDLLLGERYTIQQQLDRQSEPRIQNLFSQTLYSARGGQRLTDGSAAQLRHILSALDLVPLAANRGDLFPADLRCGSVPGGRRGRTGAFSAQRQLQRCEVCRAVPDPNGIVRHAGDLPGTICPQTLDVDSSH